MKNIGIRGIGSYVPPKKITNKDLEPFLNTTDEWIVARTGIKQRFFSEEEERCSDLALKAVNNLFEKIKFDPREVDLVIVATSTPDYKGYPSTACIVQEKIGAKNAVAFDISAACTGLIYAISVAKAFIGSNIYKNILVIGSEKNSQILDMSDRNTAVLFGDGASALLISDNANNVILDCKLFSDGSGAEVLKVDPKIKMEGKSVFKFATTRGEKIIREILEENSIEVSDIKKIISHQANKRILQRISKKLSFSEKNFYFNGDKYANTSSASVGIALDEFLKENNIKDKDKLILVSFGAGLTAGAIILETRR